MENYVYPELVPTLEVYLNDMYTKISVCVARDGDHWHSVLPRDKL